MDDYYGIEITAIGNGDRWKWRVSVPIGVSVTSNRDYATDTQALAQGRYWVRAEAAFSCLNSCLSELCSRGLLHRREYCDLMDSLMEVTQKY